MRKWALDVSSSARSPTCTTALQIIHGLEQTENSFRIVLSGFMFHNLFAFFLTKSYHVSGYLKILLKENKRSKMSNSIYLQHTWKESTSYKLIIQYSNKKIEKNTKQFIEQIQTHNKHRQLFMLTCNHRNTNWINNKIFFYLSKQQKHFRN